MVEKNTYGFFALDYLSVHRIYLVLTVMPSVPAEITANDMSRNSPCSTTPTVSNICRPIQEKNINGREGRGGGEGGNGMISGFDPSREKMGQRNEIARAQDHDVEMEGEKMTLLIQNTFFFSLLCAICSSETNEDTIRTTPSQDGQGANLTFCPPRGAYLLNRHHFCSKYECLRLGCLHAIVQKSDL